MTNDFHTVIDRLAQQYHLICVNYDGFDDRMAERPFTDMLTVTKKSRGISSRGTEAAWTAPMVPLLAAVL